MSNDKDLNERGNHEDSFTQGVGGWAEYTVHMTEVKDAVRYDLKVPPKKVIPIIFLPGVMGSNLRMSKARQDELGRNDNRAWRPDDMVNVGGIAGVISGKGFAGWFKNATPAQRQLNFDPDETEVEYYHYTENNDRFDPEGKETLASDARHCNIPDSFLPIPPLLSSHLSGNSSGKKNQPKSATAAQLARWRGWSEVLFNGSYGEVLQTVEKLLNNIVDKNGLKKFWINDKSSGYPYRDLMALLSEPPEKFGASSGKVLSKDELIKISPCWYPVHAIGYNFLKSNGDSAVAVANRIRGLVKGYKSKGFECNEVIIITHSMGGLLGRALLHPNYGNLLADEDVKVLGMYHSAMPAAGAAATYKRMRFGFQEKDSWLAETQARIFGINGQHATAILANTPGPLELLPAEVYGSNWLRVESAIEEPIGSWPAAGSKVFEEIYGKPDSSWWRLVNPLWVNPGNKGVENGGGIEATYKRLERACDFLNSIKNTYHPSNCWMSYCSSVERRSYGEVVFFVANIDIYGDELKKLPSPSTWKLLSDDGRGRLSVQAGHRKLILQIKRPRARGDETVPSKRSAQVGKGFHFIHGNSDDSIYEHQDSYSNVHVLAAMIYSIVKIANLANWK